eukprot:m.227723 g.227723  ORF g.227723 m.227723 type:complete len:1192 (+) comp17326_c0_seq2:101-3676(+)
MPLGATHLLVGLLLLCCHRGYCDSGTSYDGCQKDHLVLKCSNIADGIRTSSSSAITTNLDCLDLSAHLVSLNHTIYVQANASIRLAALTLQLSHLDIIVCPSILFNVTLATELIVLSASTFRIQPASLSTSLKHASLPVIHWQDPFFNTPRSYTTVPTSLTKRSVQLTFRNARFEGSVYLTDVQIRQSASKQPSFNPSCATVYRSGLSTVLQGSPQATTVNLEHCNIIGLNDTLIQLPSTTQLHLTFVAVHASNGCHGVHLNGTAKTTFEEVLVRSSDAAQPGRQRVGVAHHGQQFRAEKLTVFGFDFGIIYNVTAQEYTSMHDVIIDTCAVGFEVADFSFAGSVFGLGALDLVNLTIKNATNVSIVLDGRNLLLQNTALVNTGEIGVLVRNGLPWRRELHNTANLPGDTCKYKEFINARTTNIVNLTVVSRASNTIALAMMAESSNIISGISVLDAAADNPGVLVAWPETAYLAFGNRSFSPASTVRTALRNVIHSPGTLSVRFPSKALAVGLLDLDGSLTGQQETYLTSRAPSLALTEPTVTKFDVKVQGEADACVLDEPSCRFVRIILVDQETDAQYHFPSFNSTIAINVSKGKGLASIEFSANRDYIEFPARVNQTYYASSLSSSEIFGALEVQDLSRYDFVILARDEAMFGPHPKFCGTVPASGDGEMVQHNQNNFYLQFRELPLLASKPSSEAIRRSPSTVMYRHDGLIHSYLRQPSASCSSLVSINEEHGVADASECDHVTPKNEFSCIKYHDLEVFHASELAHEYGLKSAWVRAKPEPGADEVAVYVQTDHGPMTHFVDASLFRTRYLWFMIEDAPDEVNAEIPVGTGPDGIRCESWLPRQAMPLEALRESRHRRDRVQAAFDEPHNKGRATSSTALTAWMGGAASVLVLVMGLFKMLQRPSSIDSQTSQESDSSVPYSPFSQEQLDKLVDIEREMNECIVANVRDRFMTLASEWSCDLESPMTSASPALVAVQLGHHVALELLLARTEQVAHLADEQGKTLLHWACQLNELKCIDLLLPRCSAAPVTYTIHLTPLHLAVSEDNAAAVDLLVRTLPAERRAVWLQARSAAEETALDMAKRLQLDDIAELLSRDAASSSDSSDPSLSKAKRQAIQRASWHRREGKRRSQQDELEAKVVKLQASNSLAGIAISSVKGDLARLQKLQGQEPLNDPRQLPDVNMVIS